MKLKINFKSLRMKGLISKRKEWFGYLLFALIFTVALLFYCFPSDAVQDYFRAMGLRANPRLALSADRIEPSILVGLKFMKTKVALEDTPDRVILTAERVLIKPQLLSLLLGKSKFSFHCAAYRGDASGSVLFTKDPKMGFIDTEMALTNIHVGDYPYLSHLIGRPLEGTLGGTISYSGHNLMSDGSGKANLRLSDGKVNFVQPFLTLESIDFREMEIDAVFEKQKINVTRLELKGEQLQGTLSGTITIKEQLDQSSLDLKGTIEPFAALFKSNPEIQATVAVLKQRLDQGTLSFVIHGTVKEPLIKFT
jgi:type II secretion system protein N